MLTEISVISVLVLQSLKMAEFFKVKFFNLAEDEIDFNSFTKFALLLFRIFGLDFRPMTEAVTLKSRIAYNVKLSFAWICLICFSVSTIQSLLYAASSEDFVVATNAVKDALSIFLISVKTVVTFSRKNQIWEIFEEMKSLSDGRKNQNVKYEVKSYLDKYQRIVKVEAAIFVSCFPPTVFFTFLYLINGTMKLPANLWYPFNPFQIKSFLYASIWIDWITVLGLSFFLASDSLLYSLITVIAMEFGILKRDLMDLKVESKTDRNTKTVSLIIRHNKLLDLSDKLQEIYGPTFLGCFVVSSLILCFCLFLLSSGELDFAAYMLYVPYMAMFLGQIFLLCMFGQKVIDSSLAVAEGAYHNNWADDSDNCFKKSIGLIILRSQRAKELKAMRFTKVSLESFTTVRSKYYLRAVIKYFN